MNKEMKADSCDLHQALLKPEVFHNLVWTAADIADFSRAVLPLAQAAAESGRLVIYIHYSGCEILFEEKLFPEGSFFMQEVPLSHRFEVFTAAVYSLIAEGGEDSVYLFDPLSMLQAAWTTDLMMENFITVMTCLVRKKGVSAHYPLLRGRHSLPTHEQIRSCTSAFLELYSDFKNLYLRPLRLEPDNRCQAAPCSGSEEQDQSPRGPGAENHWQDVPGPVKEKKDQSLQGPGTENLMADLMVPCVFDAEDGRFYPIRDGVLESHFRKAVNLERRKGAMRNLDSWDRFFDRVQRDYEDGRDVTDACRMMAAVMMSRDDRIVELLEEHFEPEDYFFVKEHMIGTGMVGGKSCGMLTARKIIENRCPEIYDRMEPHDSFFIGSDVFYTYIVKNGFWELFVEQRKPEGYFALADELADRLLNGSFPDNLREEFRELLDFYEPSPVIVRSSSILEDGFGNAFAGKYESVFCPGNGTLEERLLEFENAIRVVYASTLSRSALDYRLRRGLGDRDEQMAILVMRVSGSHFGEYYFPCAAGVGYSYSTYRFLDSLDPRAGMLRLVMGLGTGAVDRMQGSYPRLVSLDKPAALPYKSGAEHHKFSQRNLDVIDRQAGEMKQIPFYQIENEVPSFIKRAVFGHDFEAERRLADQGQNRSVYFISCGGLVKNAQLMGDMRRMMQELQEEYGQPVDIEFTINLSEDGEYVINLLQCRPLQAFEDSGRQGIPEDLPEEEVFLDCRHCTLGNSQKMEVDFILYVDPIEYYRMPFKEKDRIARCIGAVNWYYRDKGKNMLLMVPGRLGTSSPELGVPTAFSDISSFRAVFEIAESRVGYNPELSYGSHMFQDLVESEILYAAVFEDPRTKIFRPEAFTCLENIIEKIDPAAGEYAQIVRLYDVREKACLLLHDLIGERIVCMMKE